jgi:hypothetical protein
MKPTRIFPLLAAAIAAVSSAHAAVISINDYTLVPDGTQFGSNNPNLPAAQEAQLSNVQTLNGGTAVLPTGNATTNTTSTVYMVSSFVFGTGTAADMYLNFAASVGQDRLGISISNAGIATIVGRGNPLPTFNLNQSMAGATVTILLEYLYDFNRNTTNADDTLLNVWINPTGSTAPSNGLAAGDLNTVWNSSSFVFLEQRIDNNATPGTAESSSILNTTILTGTDATFANAIALIPEPSAALLGGLGLLALLRRRRNA